MLATYFFWCVLFVCYVTVPAAEWNYKSDKGPSMWHTLFPRYCSGTKQSPIALTANAAVYDSQIINYNYLYDTSSNFVLTFKNNGHSLSVDFPTASPLKLGLIGHTEVFYTAANIHWHWGSATGKGSEHSLNGKFYEAEGHLVTWNSYMYDSFATAVTSPGGLAVVGVFFEKSSTDNPLLSKWESSISNAILTNSGGNTTLTVNPADYNIFNLFLPSKHEFLRYEGSLTTPTCNENVLWTVYTNTVPISDRQLNFFRALKFSDGSAMVDNFRPPLSLNKQTPPRTARAVYKNYNSASHLSVSQFVFYPVVVVMAFFKLQ